LKTKITLRDLGHVIDDIHKMGHKILLDIGGNRCTVALDGTKIGETLDPSSTTFGNRPKFSEAYLLLVGMRAGIAREIDQRVKAAALDDFVGVCTCSEGECELHPSSQYTEKAQARRREENSK